MKSANKEIGFGKQTIAKVFEEWYTVPSYQRHYVWESDNVNDMLDDFASNYIEHAKEEYFLGSYIIQSKSNNNDLLDGQQRITTLFLLFAFLRDYAGSSEDVKVNCVDLIFQKANKIKQIPERIRLSYEIRGNVRKFIEEYLMTSGSITQHWDDIVKKANDKKECTSIQRMCNALVCYNEFFTNHKEIDLESFLIFILNNVVMIYISADSLEDAFRLFSVMNDRGQKLSNADILKSSNLEKIEDGSEMNEYAREWENMQEDLGNDFDRFLAYVRTMLLKKRQKTNLLDEYEKQIFKAGKIKQGKDFFNYVFRAYEDYNKLINLAGNEDTEYCSLIRILIKCMPSTDWIPVILAYGRKFGDNGLLEFSQKVACKNIADAVCGKSPSYRIDHLNSIINLIEESGKPSDVLDAQGYYSFNEHVFMANIQSEIYGRRYTYALLMLLEYKYKVLPRSWLLKSSTDSTRRPLIRKCRISSTIRWILPSLVVPSQRRYKIFSVTIGSTPSARSIRWPMVKAGLRSSTTSGMHFSSIPTKTSWLSLPRCAYSLTTNKPRPSATSTFPPPMLR